ncbi:ABC transporter permease [Sinosporangium siamense]|uniref:Transport permease protein n=1 Tax=Sinosporangium siamense TaxID=1367973 RepID=A0A919RFE7_9ACTN|nr:ABC transporter permease [Sinosporangium siamense]GII92905.1 transport permease protein [Sinosporangium siamense]
MTTLAPRNWRGSGFATQVLVLTERSLRATTRNPKLMVAALVQPLVMVVLFTQVFSSMADTRNFPAGVGYVDFLMPAFMAVSGLSAASEAGVGLTTEMRNGVLARFRSMPISRVSVLFARSLSDLIKNAVQLALLLAFSALVFGFRAPGGVPGLLGAFLLALLVSWAMIWVFLALGAWLGNAETMQAVGFLALFPLMFFSSMFVPVANLPTWLQVIAHANPLTYAIDATRDLALGAPAGGIVLTSVAACAVLALAGATAATARFRRPL